MGGLKMREGALFGIRSEVQAITTAFFSLRFVYYYCRVISY